MSRSSASTNNCMCVLLDALYTVIAGVRVSPDAMFDVQVKRIHEYKRQLLKWVARGIVSSTIKGIPS